MCSNTCLFILMSFMPGTVRSRVACLLRVTCLITERRVWLHTCTCSLILALSDTCAVLFFIRYVCYIRYGTALIAASCSLLGGTIVTYLTEMFPFLGSLQCCDDVIALGTLYHNAWCTLDSWRPRKAFAQAILSERPEKKLLLSWSEHIVLEAKSRHAPCRLKR